MKKVGKERINWPVTILLIAGLITVVFPLYMTVVIALKKDPETEMNDQKERKNSGKASSGTKRSRRKRRCGIQAESRE